MVGHHIVAQYQADNPKVKISLIGGVIDTVLPALMNGDLDLICVSLDFPSRSEVFKQPLFDIQHILIADPSHPLSMQVSVSAADVQPYPWMVLKSD